MSIKKLLSEVRDVLVENPESLSDYQAALRAKNFEVSAEEAARNQHILRATKEAVQALEIMTGTFRAEVGKDIDQFEHVVKVLKAMSVPQNLLTIKAPPKLRFMK